MGNHFGNERLAVSMFIDIVGYSELAGKDEYLCLQQLGEYREIVRRMITLHKGREIDTIGDGFFIEFTSARDSVNCAITIQKAFQKRNLEVPEDLLLNVRIGIHLGEVVELENSIFGDSVNIASRIEGLAKPGGICISQAVYNQVSGKVEATFEKRKPVQLKNIQEKQVVYDIINKWTPKELRSKEVRDMNKFMNSFSRLPGGKNLDSTLLLLQIAFAAFLTLSAVYSGFKATSNDYSQYDRFIASNSVQLEKVDLSEGWQISFDQQEWKPFDPKKGYVWNTKEAGKYWLKKEFDLPNGVNYEQPSILLGHISDDSKIHLNGQYVGSTTYRYQLAKVEFDRTLLKPEANTLFIHGFTQPRIKTGLLELPSIGTYLGETSLVFKSQSKYWYDFHLLPFAYLCIVLVCAACCFFVFYKSPHNKHALYFGIFMLIGATTLLNHNVFIAQNFNGYDEFFMNVVTAILGSSVLFSAFLAQQYWNIAEAINNAASMIFGTIIAYVAFTKNSTPVELANLYYISIACLFVYTFAWNICVAWVNYSKILVAKSTEQMYAGAVEDNFGPFLFNLFGAVLLIAMAEYIGWIDLMVPNFSNNYSGTVRNVRLFYPAFFALALVATMVVRYVKLNKEKVYVETRDNQIKKLVHQIGTQESLVKAAENIMKNTATFIEAERCTLYLLCENKEDDSLYLKLSHSYLENTKKKEFIKQEVALGSGILDYVYNSRVPFFTNKIDKEMRFSSFFTSDSSKSYKTSGCIVVPLIIEGNFEGVLSFADKKGNKPFTQGDFEFVRLVGLNMGLVSSVTRLQNLNSELKKAA